MHARAEPALPAFRLFGVRKGGSLPYSYLVIMVCLPVTFVFTSLMNGGGPGAIANTFMAVFLVLLLADWRNMIVMLVASAVIAAAAYMLIDPNPRIPPDYVL